MELSPLYGVSHWRKQLLPYTVILIIEGASGGPGRKGKNENEATRIGRRKLLLALKLSTTFLQSKLSPEFKSFIF